MWSLQDTIGSNGVNGLNGLNGVNSVNGSTQLDAATLLSTAQKRTASAFSCVPRQIEGAENTILCSLMCSMHEDDHIEFQFDRIVFKQIKELKSELAFNEEELTAFLVLCAQSSPSMWSIQTTNKVALVLSDERISGILNESKSALVCTLSEPTAEAAWEKPPVQLAILGSFMFPALDLADVHRSIFGVFVQADERRCNSLHSRIIDRPLHTMLKARVAEALAAAVCPL